MRIATFEVLGLQSKLKPLVGAPEGAVEEHLGA
jgi:hypothetical protein